MNALRNRLLLLNRDLENPQDLCDLILGRNLSMKNFEIGLQKKALLLKHLLHIHLLKTELQKGLIAHFWNLQQC